MPAFSQLSFAIFDLKNCVGLPQSKTKRLPVAPKKKITRGGFIDLFERSEFLIDRPVTMETRCFHKKLEFQRYPPKDFCTARYEHKSSKKKFQTFRKPRKKPFLGRSWAKIGLRKTQPNVCSKRRDSESWTDIERQNQRLRNEI